MKLNKTYFNLIDKIEKCRTISPLELAENWKQIDRERTREDKPVELK